MSVGSVDEPTGRDDEDAIENDRDSPTREKEGTKSIERADRNSLTQKREERGTTRDAANVEMYASQEKRTTEPNEVL